MKKNRKTKERKCNEICTHAKGNKCNCICGGKNHGKYWKKKNNYFDDIEKKK